LGTLSPIPLQGRYQASSLREDGFAAALFLAVLKALDLIYHKTIVLWKDFTSMTSSEFSHPIFERRGAKMSEKEQAYWRKFLETGQVADYLRYRKYTAERAENPRFRIEETSRHKKFY